MAMPADTAAVTNGSAHAGPKCEGCAKTSNQRHDRAQRCLAADAVRGPVHLNEKRDSDHRANSPTNRSENDVLETERIENIAPRHYQKAGEPRTCEFFGSRPAKATDPQFIECKPTQF